VVASNNYLVLKLQVIEKIEEFNEVLFSSIPREITSANENIT
jgi:hypothetical protein